MNVKLLMTAFVFIACTGLATAQTKTETLTNATIIKLVKAGLDNEIVVSKIEASACKFDLSGDGLVALKGAGVPSDVIKAMMNKAEGKKQTVAPTPAASVTPAPSSGAPEPEIINAVYFYDKPAKKAVPLERNTAALKSKMKALGYGGTELVYELPGDKSSVRLKKDDAASFIVNTGNGTADNFVLYKVVTKKNTRQAIGGKFTMTGMQGSQGVIAVDVKVIKPGLFELIPVKSVEKGEYFFATKSGDNVATSSANVYAFGVD